MSRQPLRVVPSTIKAASRYVGLHHRHNRPPQGALFACAVADPTGTIRGVGIAGHPKARMLMGTGTCEAVRVCTDGTPNACSMIYGALARAAKALGWDAIITYTLTSEPGTSLRAAGWTIDGTVTGSHDWSRGRVSATRGQPDLWGNVATPKENKTRWKRQLTNMNL